MNWDISSVLDKWDYQPGRSLCGASKSRNGVEKLQLRVDLGILQMNVEGAPMAGGRWGMLRCIVSPRALLRVCGRT
jgi:hypothetical protein